MLVDDYDVAQTVTEVGTSHVWHSNSGTRITKYCCQRLLSLKRSVVHFRFVEMTEAPVVRLKKTMYNDRQLKGGGAAAGVRKEVVDITGE
jgi:hypothetical protein